MRMDPLRRAGRCDPTAGSARRAPLRFEELEPRDVPAIFIQIDYSRDTGFFLNNPEARATLERAAYDLGITLSANLAALVPSGANTFAASFFDPTTGAQLVVPNLVVGANTVRVFVGARPMPGVQAGFGGPGGYSASGSTAWLNLLSTRGHSGFAPWGGSVAFDSSERWHFGATTSGLDANELDFYSVAVHELGHILGFGTAPQWNALAANGFFYGPNAVATYGGPVPLSPDGAHWADGLTHAGRPATLDPVLNYGARVGWGALDAAALRDLGWANQSAPAAPPAAPPPVVPPPPPPAAAVTPDQLVPVPVPRGGVDFYAGAALLGRYTPFPGYTGTVGVATGDFDGDGVRDFAFATGSAGPNSAVRVLSGRGFDIVGPTVLLPGFTLGVSIAASDVDGNGRAELVVGAGPGGLPAVVVFDAGGGALTPRAALIAFEAVTYSGGVRVASGDLNRDGFGDVVVTTANGVGAVGVYSGAALRGGAAQLLWPATLPFGAVPFGLSAVVGDFDGDGRPDLALTQTAGPRATVVWAGAALAPVGAGASATARQEPEQPPAEERRDARAAGARAEPVYSATLDPIAGRCACAGCRALAELAARADA